MDHERTDIQDSNSAQCTIVHRALKNKFLCRKCPFLSTEQQTAVNIGFMKSDPRARTSEQSINSIAYTPETNYFNPIIYTE